MAGKDRGRAGPKDGGRRRGARPDDGAAWIWGHHAAAAALANPQRQVLEILATPNAIKLLKIGHPKLTEATPKEIDSRLPPGAVHQGVALRAAALPAAKLEELGKPAHGVLLVLDQVTDPRNAGAVLRSAAAFGARGVVMQDRKSPPLSGGLAKTAVGAAETVPVARVTNLSKAITELNERGWRTIGLAGEAETALADAAGDSEAVAFVLGAEDKGLRPSVAEACQVLARIPITQGVESLNVSTAAAIALYEVSRRR